MTKNDTADNRVINNTWRKKNHVCKQVCKHFVYMHTQQYFQIGDIPTYLLHKSDCTLTTSNWNCSHKIFM